MWLRLSELPRHLLACLPRPGVAGSLPTCTCSAFTCYGKSSYGISSCGINCFVVPSSGISSPRLSSPRLSSLGYPPLGYSPLGYPSLDYPLWIILPCDTFLWDTLRLDDLAVSVCKCLGSGCTSRSLADQTAQRSSHYSDDMCGLASHLRPTPLSKTTRIRTRQRSIWLGQPPM